MKVYKHHLFTFTLLTFDFGANVFPEASFILRFSGFPLVHTIVELLKHGRLENNYPDFLQGAGRILAQHINHCIQHGIRHLPCLYITLT